jgi:hypothetical protein
MVLDTYDDATEDVEMHLFMSGHDGLTLRLPNLFLNFSTLCM